MLDTQQRPEMSADDADEAERLLAFYELTDDDLRNIRAFGDIVLPRIDDYVDQFYAWLRTQPEYAEHFSDSSRLAGVKKDQVIYWQQFFAARVDADYVAARRRVGQVHAHIGLSLQAYFGAMNLSLVVFVERLYDDSLSSRAYADAVRAVTKLIHFDTALVAETYSTLVGETIAEQSKSLMQMSTPVTAIWDGILLLPVVGFIDSKRAQDIMHAMLTNISQAQAKVFILDISGVAVVDTAVANHLIKITKATRLMGCACTISGISPAIAQTIVELGVEVGTVKTTSTMKDALSDAFRVTRVDPAVLR